MAQNFQFQEEDPVAYKRGAQKKVPGIAGLFIKWGLAKTEKQANLWMIIIIIVCVAIVLFQQVL